MWQAAVQFEGALRDFAHTNGLFALRLVPLRVITLDTAPRREEFCTTAVNARGSAQVVQKSKSHIKIRGSGCVKRGELPFVGRQGPQTFNTTVRNSVACDSLYH